MTPSASPTPSSEFSLKPEAVAPSGSVKPLPQATIKLQAAPVPAAARKPYLASVVSAPVASEVSAENEGDLSNAHESSDDETEGKDSESVPMPIAIAAALLALLAVAVQVWTLFF